MFHDPALLAGLVLVPVLFYLRWRRGGEQRPGVRFPSLAVAGQIAPSWSVIGRKGLVLLRGGAIAFAVIALARPQKGLEETRVRTEGIDIILCLDVSESMRAMDFQLDGRRHDRLAVVKVVAREFVEGRADDRIGIVVYAPRAYTLSPLTLDHGWVVKQLERVEIGMVDKGAATAIGSALHTALRRLEESGAKSKVIVLLTDGRNNAGNISPETAAEAARALGIKIYCIGAGTKEPAPYPVRDLLGNVALRMRNIEIDDERLTRVAEVTGGKYFRATDTAGLREIYREIDRMEKTDIDALLYTDYREFYPYLLIPALCLLLLEAALGRTRLGRIP